MEIFGQKWKFWPKMEILAKHGNFGQNRNVGQKIEISVKNPNFLDPKIYINFF